MSIIPRAVCLRHSREDWCVYVERKHRDHIRGRDPRCCRVQSPGQSCDVAPREGWKSRAVETQEVFILQ